MTKKQSIDYLKDLWNEVYNEDSDGYNYAEAIDMAIEALSIEAMPIEEVWECVQPLKDKILNLEEKLIDAEAIVRCKNCIFGISDYPLHLFPNRTKAQARQYSCEHSTYSHDADFFCAYGKERKDYREFNF